MNVRESERTLAIDGHIDVRGKCSKESGDECVNVALTVDGASMKGGLSAQQRKMSIALLQEMHAKALAFFGHTISPGLMPGMVVRAILPGGSFDNPRYMGVVETIEKDRVVLRTLDAAGNEIAEEFQRSNYEIRQDPQYTGIEGLKDAVRDGRGLPQDLRAAHVAYFRSLERTMAIEGVINSFTVQPQSPASIWDALIGSAIGRHTTRIWFYPATPTLGVRDIWFGYHPTQQRWDIPQAFDREALYDYIKKSAGMTRDADVRQRGLFTCEWSENRNRGITRTVQCSVETYFSDCGHGEGLIISLKY